MSHCIVSLIRSGIRVIPWTQTKIRLEKKYNFKMDESSDYHLNSTQWNGKDVKWIIMGDGADIKVNEVVETKTDSNTLLIKALLGENALL